MRGQGAEFLHELRRKGLHIRDMSWNEGVAVMECIATHGGAADEEFEKAFMQLLWEAPLRRDDPQGSRMSEFEYGMMFMLTACEFPAYRWQCLEFMFGVYEKSWEPSSYAEFVAKAIVESLLLESGVLLLFLKQKGLYIPQAEYRYYRGGKIAHPLHVVGNGVACTQLLEEGHDPHGVLDGRTVLQTACDRCSQYVYPDTASVHGKQQVLRVLLRRCDPEPLLGQRLCALALDAVLESRPDLSCRVVAAQQLQYCIPEVDRSCNAMLLPELCRLMATFRKHRVQIGDVKAVIDQCTGSPFLEMRRVIVSTSFMFGFVDSLPENFHLHPTHSLPFFLWRPRWHHYHSEKVRKRIFQFLLVLNRVCPAARDVRFRIIDMMVCLELSASQQYNPMYAESLFARNLDPFLPRAHRLC